MVSSVIHCNHTSHSDTSYLCSIVAGEDWEDNPPGQCDMHLAALAMGLALSFVQRVENGVVVNYWGPFCDLYKKAEKLGKLVFGKKSKTEYDLYLNLLKSQNMDVIGCRMMNKTRVGGCHLFIQDLLRSKFTLDHYASTKASVRAIYLSPEEWAQLSEFAAVLDKAVRLCFFSQED